MNRLVGEQLDRTYENLLNMAGPAHALIMSYVEGKPVDFNRLENYMSAAHDLLQDSGLVGGLIECALEELLNAE